MYKVARRIIMEGIRKFDENKISEIIEEKKSTRKMKKEMCEGYNLIIQLGC